MPAKKNTSKKLVIILSILGVLLIAVGVWQFISLRNDNKSLSSRLDEKTAELETLKSNLASDPSGTVSKIQQEQNASILEKISEVYAIPEGETPTIATVQDISKLSEQPFFEGAENGDILVVFNDSSQAIIYRPGTEQLVKVGPISGEASANKKPAPPAASEEE